MNTPWGKADDVTLVKRGIYWVSTPSHGGVMIDRKVGDSVLSDDAKKVGAGFGFTPANPWSKDWYVFEEDCDWRIAANEIPEINEY